MEDAFHRSHHFGVRRVGGIRHGALTKGHHQRPPDQPNIPAEVGRVVDVPQSPHEPRGRKERGDERKWSKHRLHRARSSAESWRGHGNSSLASCGISKRLRMKASVNFRRSDHMHLDSAHQLFVTTTVPAGSKRHMISALHRKPTSNATLIPRLHGIVHGVGKVLVAILRSAC